MGGFRDHVQVIGVRVGQVVRWCRKQTRNFSLMMHHVAAEDAGMYECKIELESGKENISSRFQVTVRTGGSQINHIIVKVSISFPGWKVSTSLKIYIPFVFSGKDYSKSSSANRTLPSTSSATSPSPNSTKKQDDYQFYFIPFLCVCVIMVVLVVFCIYLVVKVIQLQRGKLAVIPHFIHSLLWDNLFL